MIGFIAPYRFTDLHTIQFTVTHTLQVVSCQRICHRSHCHFKSHRLLKENSITPFLSLFCSCQFRRLSSIPLFPSANPGRLASRSSTLRFRLCSMLLYDAEHFFITTLHGPRGKHRLLLSRIVLVVFTEGTCLPSRFPAMGIHGTITCIAPTHRIYIFLPFHPTLFNRRYNQFLSFLWRRDQVFIST
jgi:hypothetical protein